MNIADVLVGDILHHEQYGRVIVVDKVDEGRRAYLVGPTCTLIPEDLSGFTSLVVFDPSGLNLPRTSLSGPHAGVSWTPSHHAAVFEAGRRAALAALGRVPHPPEPQTEGARVQVKCHNGTSEIWFRFQADSDRHWGNSAGAAVGWSEVCAMGDVSVMD